VGITWAKLMALMNGFIKLRLATFFSDIARVIFRGYRSMPATIQNRYTNQQNSTNRERGNKIRKE